MVDRVFEGETGGFLIAFDQVVVDVALVIELEGVPYEVFAHLWVEDGLHDPLDVPPLDAAQFDEPAQPYPVVLYLGHIRKQEDGIEKRRYALSDRLQTKSHLCPAYRPNLKVGYCVLGSC